MDIMKKSVLLSLFVLIGPNIALADSFLSAQGFPSTFNDLDFSTRQEFKAEDYALFAGLSAYDQLNIVYTDQDTAEEIAQNEATDATTPASTTTTPTINTGASNSGPNTSSTTFCAIKNPAIPSGQKIPIGKPVLESDYTFCSPYGKRNFGTKDKPKWDNHYGFDIGCTERHYNKPIFATADGTVDTVKYNKKGSSAGNYIRINHGNGFKTYYMHLNQILVQQGQHVSAGCQIGTLGNTGGAKAFKNTLQTDYPTMKKSISHLHYEMHYSGNENSVSGIKIQHGFSNHKSVDPAYFMGVKK